MQAIETRYAGCRFRSRLEARWAVFFDTAGIEWQYEPQGFTLEDGSRYLPDFWLPQCNTWFEVKGTAPPVGEQEKLVQFAFELPHAPRGLGNKSLRGLQISQYLKVAIGDIPESPPNREREFRKAEIFSPGYIWRIITWKDENSGNHLDFAARWWQKCKRGHVYVGWGHCWVCDYVIGDDDPYTYQYDDLINDAHHAARSARFEHGQSG